MIAPRGEHPVHIYEVLDTADLGAEDDAVMRQTTFWRGLLGAVILFLVLVFPGGIVGALGKRLAGRRTAG